MPHSSLTVSIPPRVDPPILVAQERGDLTRRDSTLLNAYEHVASHYSQGAYAWNWPISFTGAIGMLASRALVRWHSLVRYRLLTGVLIVIYVAYSLFIVLRRLNTPKSLHGLCILCDCDTITRYPSSSS
ncbi:unnamed protein product [Rhizoctonia solani]|uniref:Uncharacterized protein n=1 Tax=Rhizoctonia solani TaxID=456999 RepID=A0A8H3B1V1_9AGAM|nr:unnamed protein product [Rhizoctonia solani]